LVPGKDHEPAYARYTDDPEVGYGEPGILLQTQQRLMDGSYCYRPAIGIVPLMNVLSSEQDGHLDQLSHSIHRQRDISLQINDELDVHTGLLEELDTELDQTEGRLSGARRRLERVARGTKENGKSSSCQEFCKIADDTTLRDIGSTVMIVVLILLLLILIIAFKT
jgi:syntaxin 8